MRDGSSRTPRSTNRTGTSPDVSVERWRACVRPSVLRDLAEGTQGLTWTNELLVALLEELHITEEFDHLIGRVRLDAARDAARLLALALFLRHSWDSADLSSVVDRVLFPPHATDVPSTTTTPRDTRGDGTSPSTRTSPLASTQPRTRKELP